MEIRLNFGFKARLFAFASIRGKHHHLGPHYDGQPPGTERTSGQGRANGDYLGAPQSREKERASERRLLMTSESLKRRVVEFVKNSL